MIRIVAGFSLLPACLLLALNPLLAQTTAPTSSQTTAQTNSHTIQLPAIQAPPSGVPFHFDAAVRSPIPPPGAPRWTVLGVTRVYDRHDLPALFTRSLALDHGIPPGSVLSWIFTGDQGGITIELSPTSVTIRQRYFDSLALNPQHPPRDPYPQATWAEDRIALEGQPHLLTLVLDSELALRVLVNGVQVAKQTCLMDVRRQQIAWEPPPGDLTATLDGRSLAPDPIPATLSVDSRSRHQSILGFGGSVSVPAYAQLSAPGKQLWWKFVAEYNLLIQREYPTGQHLKPDLSNFDRLADASPHYYGDNFPNGEVSDFTYLKRIRALGGKTIFEFWQLPPWVQHTVTAADGKPAQTVDIDQYVRAVVGYCKAALKAAGFPPGIVGVQNEIVQSPETWRQMILQLRAGLDRAGFQAVKIQMPDATSLSVGVNTAKTLTAMPDAWAAIDYAASHVYDFQSFFEHPDGYDDVMRQFHQAVGAKPFLATEFAVNRPAYQTGSYRAAFAMAQLYHKTLTILDAETLLYCWTLLDVEQPSFGATRSLFIPGRDNGYLPRASSFQLRTYGAFSRRLREGMVRVETHSTDPELLSTAFEGPNGLRTAIVINRSTAPRSLQVDWPGGRFTVLEVASPYSPNQAVKLPPGPVLVQPGEIVTLSNVPLRE